MASLSTSSPMARFCRDIKDTTVRIVAGEGDEAHTFTVPKAFLCAKSSWFATILKPSYKEGQTNTINLPEDSPAAVEACIYFLYNGDLAFDDSQDQENRTAEQVALACEIWMLGDKLGLPRLQNCAMMRLCRLLRRAPGSSKAIDIPTLAICLGTTVPNYGPLRAVAIDYMADKIERGAASVQDFDNCGILANCRVDLSDARAMWHRNKQDAEVNHPIDFPRYLKPLHNLGALRVRYKAAAADPEYGTSDYLGLYNALDYDSDEFKPTCQECGIQWASARSSCCNKFLDCTCGVDHLYVQRWACSECAGLG